MRRSEIMKRKLVIEWEADSITINWKGVIEAINSTNTNSLSMKLETEK